MKKVYGEARLKFAKLQLFNVAELDYPLKPGKTFGTPPLRDEYNRLPDRAPEYFDHEPMPFDRYHGPPRPAQFEQPIRPPSPYRNRFDFEREDDMVSNWVREQQLLGTMADK